MTYTEFHAAWLYSGMAFRIAIDLGIHLPSDKLQSYAKSLSPEDIEIRKRLFWSCFTWDKAISLYLGRMPNFTHSTEGISLTSVSTLLDSDPHTLFSTDRRYSGRLYRDGYLGAILWQLPES